MRGRKATIIKVMLCILYLTIFGFMLLLYWNIITNFDLGNTNFILPIYFQGNTKRIFDNSTSFLNGPNVGGSQLTNGFYNVPLLVVIK